MTNTLKVGDRVRVIKYGHSFWSWEEIEKGFPLIYRGENGMYHYDMCPEIVGKEGVISEVTVTQGVDYYAVEGIPSKHSWYTKNQLELI